MSEHIPGGTELGISVDGQFFANKKYVESLKTPKSLDRINSDTVSHTGFSKKRTVQTDYDQRLEIQERLTLTQNTIADLEKQLARHKKVEASLKQSLEELK